MASSPRKTQRKLRIFLCHSSDDKPATRDLYKRLKNDGFEPWLDEEDILPGRNWRNEISEAVRRSDIFLACLSVGSINKDGYVQKEIVFALDVADEKREGTVFIVPVKFEECEVPKRLSTWQWVDLRSNGGYAKLLLTLQTRAKLLGLDRHGPELADHKVGGSVAREEDRLCGSEADLPSVPSLSRASGPFAPVSTPAKTPPLRSEGAVHSSAEPAREEKPSGMQLVDMVKSHQGVDSHGSARGFQMSLKRSGFRDVQELYEALERDSSDAARQWRRERDEKAKAADDAQRRNRIVFGIIIVALPTMLWGLLVTMTFRLFGYHAPRWIGELCAICFVMPMSVAFFGWKSEFSPLLKFIGGLWLLIVGVITVLGLAGIKIVQ